MRNRVLVFLLVWLGALASPRAHAYMGAKQCREAYGRLGSSFNTDKQHLEFRVFSARATRIEVVLFDQPHGKEVASFPMMRRNDVWEWLVPVAKLRELKLIGEQATALDRPIYYGFRAWGKNWEYDAAWVPGSLAGYSGFEKNDKGELVKVPVKDVNEEGDRFNPNKLLTDPYGRDVTDNPIRRGMADPLIYSSGPDHRMKDSTIEAPKSIVLPDAAQLRETRPTRPWRDEVVYEAHLKGLTMNDPSIPEEERGTFRGAARKAKYLKDLGITSIEFLPVMDFQTDTNSEEDPKDSDYWGYMTLNFFSPKRSYATKQSQEKFGGVTAEFQEMIEAFHKEGIKVVMDVVYNHTGERGVWGIEGQNAQLYSFRGLDNATYYQTAGDKRYYKDNTGCGANFNCAKGPVADLVIDSLRHFHALGVDGFRFDLAPVLGNTQETGNKFLFNKMPEWGLLNRILSEVPARSYDGGTGADIIAEPWGVGGQDENVQQLGGFPSHPKTRRAWAEWNAKYRDDIRRTVNEVGVSVVTPGDLAVRIAGSDDVFADNGRLPGHTVNFVSCHDGFTLWDLIAYNLKNNNQPPPYGASDGGENNNHSWDHVLPGDNDDVTAARRREAARVVFALPQLSIGVPMFTAGDEFLRSQRGNNNMYNIDTKGNWIDWADKERNANHFAFSRGVLHFRAAHDSFRRPEYFKGRDHDGNGLKDITWYRPDGVEADGAYHRDPNAEFLAYRIDAEEHGEKGTRSIYVAYNWHPNEKTITLPPPAKGKKWYWAGDTGARFEYLGNWVEPGKEIELKDVKGNEIFVKTPEPSAVAKPAEKKADEPITYKMSGRSLAVFVER